MLTAEKSLIDPPLLVFFQKLFLCHPFPRHPLLKIEMN
jgi:hypothetical protein